MAKYSKLLISAEIEGDTDKLKRDALKAMYDNFDTYMEAGSFSGSGSSSSSSSSDNEFKKASEAYKTEADKKIALIKRELEAKKELRDEISKMNCEIGGWKEGFDPFYGAPAMLIVLAKKERPTYVYDGSLVMGNLMLAAHELGIGSCWIHRAKEEFESDWGRNLLRSLGVNGDYEGIGHCALGYADGDYPAAPARNEGRIFYVK